MADTDSTEVTEPEAETPEPATDDEPDTDENDDDGELDEGDEPATEPEPEAAALPAGVTPEEMEKRFGKIASAFKTYTNRVGTILEEQATEITECPLCAGTVPGFVVIEGAGRVDETTKSAVQTYLGVVQEADYAYDPEYRQCDRCKGRGQVRTHSEVPQWKLLVCKACQGRGYIGPPEGVANGASGPEPAYAAVAAATTPTEPPDADAFGSPRLLPDGMENPNYGRMPQYKDPRWP